MSDLIDAETNGAMTPVSAEIVAKIRATRHICKVSAQTLADRMNDLGFPVTRTMLANWESGRKNTVPVDFLVVAAKALGTDAISILREPTPVCPTCQGAPPAGFTCNSCGGAA